MRYYYSMPGMMDTVLNLGMNDQVCEGLAKKSQNPRFAWDSYRRFLEMFGNVVLEIPRYVYAKIVKCMHEKHKANFFRNSILECTLLQIVL